MSTINPPDSFFGYLSRGTRSRIRRRVALATGPNTTIFDRQNRADEIAALSALYGVDRLIIEHILMPPDQAKRVWQIHTGQLRAA
jgi:hypothetical protein